MPDFLFDQGKNKIQGSPKTTVDAIGAKVDGIAGNNAIVKNWTESDNDFNLYRLNGTCDITTGRFSANANYIILLYTFTSNNQISIVKNSGGIVGAVLYSEELETIPTSTSAAAAYFVRGARSDKTGDQALPDASNKWNVTTGQMLAIFIQTHTTSLFLNTTFTYSFNEVVKQFSNDVFFNQAQQQQIIKTFKKPIIKYGACDTETGTSTGKEQLTVFVPTITGFVKYAIVHCESNAKNANNWRIDYAYYCDNNLNVLFPITTAGEWEFAIKINNTNDFVGGIAHGNEVIDNLTVIIDGVPVDDLTTLMFQKEAREIQIVERTTLYNPNDGATLETRNNFSPIGSHGRAYIFNNEGLRLIQTLKLDVAETLTTSYMTMFPIIRGNDAVSNDQITDHYYSNNEFIVYDVSTGGSGSGYGWRQNVTRATIWGAASGVNATVEMLNQPKQSNPENGGKLFQVQNTVDAYNKFYWSICGVNNTTYEAAANEIFQTDTLYKINVNKN